jgi:hypothetical protein
MLSGIVSKLDAPVAETVETTETVEGETVAS